MVPFISCCGLAGAWLLVAGPIYQAGIELRAHELARERIESVKASITPPPRVSRWWWLLPPVKMILEARRTNALNRAYVTALSVEDLAALVSFLEKATGWMLVAAGALLLAAKETYGFAQGLHLSDPVVGLIVGTMTAGCVVGTIVQISRGDRLLAEKGHVRRR